MWPRYAIGGVKMAEERPPRPEPLHVIFDPIPHEPKYLNQWILWRYEWVEGKDGKPGKWDKPPYQPNGKHASSTAALTWSPFKTVKAAYESGLNLPVDDPLHFDGVGFVPAKVNQADNNLQFGDLDKCRDKDTGQLSREAKEDLDLINSYCEISPSGTGIRFIAIGAPPYPQGKDGGKNGHVELYQARHYLTLTGNRLPEYPATIEKRLAGLYAFYTKHFAQSEPEQSKEEAQNQSNGSKLTDDQIICLASEAKNSAKFMALMAGNIDGYPSQSEAEQACCNLVAFYTTQEEQIDRIVRRSGLYREKWERADYREGTIRKAISGAKEHYSGNGPKDFEAGKEEHPHEGMTPEEILERIRADPRALKDHDILATLAALKVNDPIEYDLLVDAIKKAHKGLKVDTIHALIDKYIQESEETKERPQDIPLDIAQAAQVIIDDCKAYEHIYKIWQKRVKGNAYLGKALLVSRGVQSCLNTKGIHVYAHGKHGHGKSEGMEKMIELLPLEYRMDEDVSPLAIHYASKNGMLLPGTTLLIDEMVWNDPLAGMIKRVITRFQKGAGHLTVIDGLPVLVRTQPRLGIWTNSADLQADEQLRDRFLDEPITESDNYVKDIIEFQKIRDTLPDSSEDVDRETAICQAILRDLAGKTFTVKIPFATRIKIEASEGTRGYNIFSDLVKGLAAMRYAQRKTNEQGQLLATEADFKDAKDIYEGSKGHSEESYTTAEITVLQAIIKHGYKSLYKDIKNITGLSEGRIKDIINGRGKDEQKRHGLRYKCPQLDVNTVDISVVIAGTYSDRVTTHPVELSLPISFSVDAGIRKNLVSLDPDVARRGPDVDPDVVDIDSNRDSDVVDVVKEKREGEDTSKLQTPSVEESIPSSKEKGQKTTSTTPRLSPIAKSTASGSATPHVNYVGVDTSKQIRVAAISEFGMCGWVDPAKLAHALNLPFDVVEAWLQANYVAYDRPNGGGIGYRQRKAVEAGRTKA
jgi:primase-polymerase (primpol)-like protein